MRTLLKCFFLTVFNICAAINSYAQVQQFTVTVSDTASLSAMPAIHSYAYGTWNGKWIFIGGRTNGLHGFTPPSGFPNMNINTNIYMVDPDSNTSMLRNVDASFTDTTLINSLHAAFFQYAQRDSMLYIVGGYGYAMDSAQYFTYPTLIAVNLKSLVDNIKNNNPVDGDFRMIQDSVFKVCGGNMYLIDSTYYLVFGHDFNHNYSVNDTLGFFEQTYTCEIRKFQINDDGVNLGISGYTAVYDSVNFHRRDFNLVPQIFPDGTFGLTAFSGVFQYQAPQPYFNSINIKPQGYEVINNFNQNLSQYISGVMPVYDSAANKMSTVFFGGMSVYELDTTTNTLITDTLIPFVNTISKVVRNADSTMAEYNNPAEMPGLTGTNSQFIPADSVPLIYGDIINLNALPFGNTFAGYLVGGISSDLPNVSSFPSFSHAESIVYRVYLNKFIDTSVRDHEIKNDILNLLVYPNPTDQTVNIDFEIKKPENIIVSVYSSQGNLVKEIFSGAVQQGKHQVIWHAASPGTYFCKVQTNTYSKSIMVVVR